MSEYHNPDVILSDGCGETRLFLWHDKQGIMVKIDSTDEPIIATFDSQDEYDEVLKSRQEYMAEEAR